MGSLRLRLDFRPGYVRRDPPSNFKLYAQRLGRLQLQLGSL